MTKVKLFKMDSSKTWEDIGNGNLSITSTHIRVSEELNNEVLFESLIQTSYYTRQCGTFLQCIDNSDHYIIGFETSIELIAAWKELAKRKGYTDTPLPFPSPSHISAILSALTSGNIEEVLMQENLEEFIANLCSEYEKATENLDDFFNVFRVLINTCAEKILKELLNKDNFQALLKVLENDPELKGLAKYVETVKTCVFNNVLDVRDEQFLELVQLNFRIRTFKEYLVTTTFDEKIGMILSSFQSFINEEIIKCYNASGEIRAGLVIKIKKIQKDALEFLNELLAIAKSIISSPSQLIFYESLYNDEILNIFPDYWNCNNFDPQEKNTAQKIILKAIGDMFQIMPWNFKTLFIKQCPSEVSFFEEFVCQSMNSDIESVQLIGEFLKFFLESMKIFGFSQLCDVFFTNIIKNFEKKLKDSNQSEWSKCEILSLLSNSIQHEPVKSRFDFVLSGLLDTLHKILSTECPSVRIAVYKFFKQIVKENDNYLINHFIRSRYFCKVFDELELTLTKENMIFSSALSILHEISNASNLELLEYTDSLFYERFENTSIASYFTKIRTRVKKMTEIPLLTSNISVDLATDENFLEIPDVLKPVKRIDPSSDLVKMFKLS